MTTKTDRDDLIAAIHDVAEQVDGSPTTKEMDEHGPYSSQPFYTEFGSWGDALEAAGYAYDDGTVSDEELLDDLRAVADELGHSPTFQEMNEHGEYHPATIATRFETFLDARKQAGLAGTKQQYGKRADKADLLDDLRRLGEELGCAPRQKDVDEHGEYVPMTYHRHFGGFLDALEEAGYDLDTTNREWPIDYPVDWLQRRESVRARDGYCCVDCGMSNTEHGNHYGQDLHVHHVHSKGDPHDKDNLVTLCADCHAKWDRVTADPRDQ